jgi:hypothetical protein
LRVIFSVIVADPMRGTGRFNVAQGAVITAQGVGAALSTTLAGLVVVQAGYSAAFLTLRGAVLGFAVYVLGTPETKATQFSEAASGNAAGLSPLRVAAE